MLLLALPLASVEIPRYDTHDFSFTATAPGGERLSVPGYYDGANTWRIRFSPAAEGKWTMRTTSALAVPDGKTDGSIVCVANRHPHIRQGGLRVDAAYPHHFIREDGSRYFLLGYEADWLWGVGEDMHTLISQLAARGFNHVLVNIYGHDTSWSPGKKHPFDFGPPAVFPWEGTNEAPDHSRLNPAFSSTTMP